MSKYRDLQRRCKVLGLGPLNVKAQVLQQRLDTWTEQHGKQKNTPRRSYALSVVTTAVLWVTMGYLLEMHGHEIALQFRPIVDIASEEINIWVDTENNFHEVCGSIRGRILHWGSCRMGMEESIFLGLLGIQIVVHWGPKIVLYLYFAIMKLCRNMLWLFKLNVHIVHTLLS